ncbi:MAG: tetratricopeptide repeat protein [Ignavibacteriaceae bacterium]
MKSFSIQSKNNLLIINYLPQLLIIGLILLVYIQNLWFDFAYLDDNLIVFIEYDKINSLLKIPGTFIGGYLFDNYYRPMVMISFIIDTAIAGQSSFMYHLTNMLLHISVCLLFYMLLSKLTTSKIFPLLLTLLFCVHPLNVNAVSWIVGRNDLIVAFFSLLSFLWFIKYMEEEKLFSLVLTMLFYLFAMYSKEIGILIPFISAAYVILIRTDKKKKINLALIIISYLIPFLIYVASRVLFSPVKVSEEISFNALLQNLNIPFEYLAKTFYFFEFNPLPMENFTLIVLGLLLVGTLILIFLFNKRINKRLFLFGVLFFLVFVIPTLFVRIKAEDLDFNYIDCRAYLPFIGILIIFLSIMETFNKDIIKSLFGKIITIIILLYASATTVIENQYYENGGTFWGRATEIYPDRATYWIGLGTYYFNKQDFNKAVQFGEKAIKINPQIPEYYYKTASAYVKEKDFNSAIELLQKVIVIEPDKSPALLNLIKLYLQIGDTINAEKSTTELISIASNKNEAKYLASASYYYFDIANVKYAINLMSLAIRIDPKNSRYKNDLGAMYYKIEDITSAKKYFLEALQIEPKNPKYRSNLDLCK